MSRAVNKSRSLVALLIAGSATPLLGRAHSEGVEAADPATPPAVLSFDGAARRYVEANAGPRAWRALFAADGDSNAAGHRMTTEAAGGAHMHSGEAEPAQHSPATHQQ